MHGYTFCFSLILLGLLNGAPAGRAETADALTLVGSTQLPHSFDNRTFTVWSGGGFLLVQDRFSSSPTIHILDRNGAETSTFTFSIPGAGRINLYDNSVARGLDGSLALIGTTYSNDSTGAMFVAWVSLDRREQTIIRTTPYFPEAVTVASDGTIWVAGELMKRKPEKPDYSQELIRHYDKTGKLLGAFLPWSTLEMNSAFSPTPSVRSVLVSAKDRVGWYSPGANTYIEFSLAGSVINRFRTVHHDPSNLITVALCEDGSVFASTGIMRDVEQTNWGILTLNRQQSDWTLLPRKEQSGMLFGCDGERIASSTDSSTVSWLEPATK
jgi:hypothetical protein